MSTRCQIAFYEDKKSEKDLNNFEALLYRHSDGYPEGVLPDIVPFLEWWKEARGMNDIEYCSARLLQYLCNEYDGHTKKHYSDIKKMHGYEQNNAFNHALNKHIDDETNGLTGLYGHGICKVFHWDIEYLYAITPDKITIYDVSFADDKDINDKVKKIGEIAINQEETDKWLEKYTWELEPVQKITISTRRQRL